MSPTSTTTKPRATEPVTVQNGRDRAVTVTGQTMIVRDTAKGTEIAVALDDVARMRLSQALRPTSTEAACDALCLLGNAIRHGEGAGVSTERERKILRGNLEYLIDQINGSAADDLDTILGRIGVTRSGAFTKGVQ